MGAVDPSFYRVGVCSGGREAGSGGPSGNTGLAREALAPTDSVCQTGRLGLCDDAWAASGALVCATTDGQRRRIRELALALVDRAASGRERLGVTGRGRLPPRRFQTRFARRERFPAGTSVPVPTFVGLRLARPGPRQL